MTNGRRETQAALIDRVFEVLDAEARAALWLYIAERESAEEIARCLGIRLPDVRRLVARGIRRLREAFRVGRTGIGCRASLRALFLELPQEAPPPELWEKTRRAAASALGELSFSERRENGGTRSSGPRGDQEPEDAR